MSLTLASLRAAPPVGRRRIPSSLLQTFRRESGASRRAAAHQRRSLRLPTTRSSIIGRSSCLAATRCYSALSAASPTRKSSSSGSILVNGDPSVFEGLGHGTPQPAPPCPGQGPPHW